MEVDNLLNKLIFNKNSFELMLCLINWAPFILTCQTKSSPASPCSKFVAYISVRKIPLRRSDHSVILRPTGANEISRLLIRLSN